MKKTIFAMLAILMIASWVGASAADMAIGKAKIGKAAVGGKVVRKK
jgi:hypothetical protein